MKSYEFLCGGDHGAWECYVDVWLTEEEEALLREFASKDQNDRLDRFKPMDKIFAKVVKALREESDGRIDKNSLVIWVPSEFRKEI